MVFLQSKTTDRMIASQGLEAPRADCPVCSPFYAKVHIKEGSKPTMQQLVDLLRVRLNYEDFSIASEGKLIYDPDLEENLPKPIADFGVDGTSIDFLTVQDDSDEPKVDLMLSVKSKPAVEGDDEIALFPDAIILPSKPPKTTTEVNGDAVDAADPEPVAAPDSGTKRKREGEDDLEEGATKKAKAEPVYTVEDDGAILLD